METKDERNARLRKVASASYARISEKMERDAQAQTDPRFAAALRQHSEAFARMSKRAGR